MRTTYDVIFSVGGACCCSEALRIARLQLASFPLDWIAGSDIRTRVDLLVQNLGDLVSPGLMRHIEELDIEDKYLYRNVKYVFNFPHDFPKGVPFETQMPKVEEKYARRMRRLDSLLTKARRALFVWVDVPSSPEVSDEDVSWCRERLAERWPGVAFDAFVFKADDGIPFARREIRRQPHVTTVRFAYRDFGFAGAGWRADHDILAACLAKGLKVRDYRDASDRARWEAFEATNKWNRFKTSNPLRRVVRGMEYRLYKHLLKRLTRKGVL